MRIHFSPPHFTLACIACLLLATGCSRSHYRQHADAEVYCLVESKSDHPHWPLEDYTMEVDPISRFYDPFNPDCPPMPPDDPVSHDLMHCVNGMCGDGCWHKNGDAPFVEDPSWINTLPRNEQGQVPLDLRTAVQIGLVNSREYQNELEDLYLSALDVSFERFRFDALFTLSNSAFLTTDARNRLREGGQSTTNVDFNTDVNASKLFASGGELMVGFANSLMWQFAGPDETSNTNTLLDFTFIQPLLRGGGRAVVLERLTLSERSLLANVRQMERYRRGFFARIANGRDAGAGPQRRGGVLGAGLTGFAGVGAGGFAGVGGGGGGGGGAGGVAGGAGAGQAGGFFGLLQQQQQISNREANLASLRDSLAQLEAAYEAGRIDRFQVDLAQQAVFNAQSQLLTTRAQFEQQFDNFKIILGLPPQLEMALNDTMLNRFRLIDPVFPPLQNRLADLQADAGTLIVRIGEEAVQPDFEVTEELGADIRRLSKSLEAASEVHRQAMSHFTAVQLDVAQLGDSLEDRRENLKKLASRNGQSDVLGIIEADLDNLEELPASLDRNLKTLEESFRAAPAAIQQLQNDLAGLESALATAEADERPVMLSDVFGEYSDMLTTLSSYVLELSLLQARARAESIVLEPIDLDAERAIEIARQFRRDWMNARASLVDVWRLIEFNANELLSTLDFVVSGDVSNRGDNPIQLDDTTGRFRVGLQFDAPIQRMAERNNYRQALIEFQRARRDFMNFTDQVARTLRNTLRSIEIDLLNFELRRAAIRVAIDQVELARLRLREPPKPGVATTFGATTARDLVSALSDLLNVQNDFLSVWVDYQVERINLDFDLGTMQLDEYGMWIDPGSAIADISRLGYAGCELDMHVAADDGEVQATSDEPPVPRKPEAGEPEAESPVEPLPEFVEPASYVFEAAEVDPSQPIFQAPRHAQQHGPAKTVSRTARAMRQENPLRSR